MTVVIEIVNNQILIFSLLRTGASPSQVQRIDSLIIKDKSDDSIDSGLSPSKDFVDDKKRYLVLCNSIHVKCFKVSFFITIL